MVTGGADACLTPLVFAGFDVLRAMSTRNDDPQKSCRPFDRDRDGFVMGEGAGILVFEELDHAKRRGAHIYGEVIGFGMTADAYHITEPDPDGMALAHERVTLSAHGGTHVDAPLHYGPLCEGKPSKSIEDVPLEWCYGPGVVLDVSRAPAWAASPSSSTQI